MAEERAQFVRRRSRRGAGPTGLSVLRACGGDGGVLAEVVRRQEERDVAATPRPQHVPANLTPFLQSIMSSEQTYIMIKCVSCFLAALSEYGANPLPPRPDGVQRGSPLPFLLSNPT